MGASRRTGGGYLDGIDAPLMGLIMGGQDHQGPTSSLYNSPYPTNAIGGYNHHQPPPQPSSHLSLHHHQQPQLPTPYPQQQHVVVGTVVGPSLLPQRSALLEEFRARGGGLSPQSNISIEDIKGSIAEFSGDQHGSRFIQEKLDQANEMERNLVYSEVKGSAMALMTDVFGNYVSFLSLSIPFSML